MSVHIGLMIWKEMKRQKISNVALATSLSVGKGRIETIIKNTSIDTDLLLKISEIMSFNFFKFYEENEIFKRIETESQQETRIEMERLNAIIIEKNKVIDLKDQLLKTQTATILLLEKGKYR